MTSTRSLRIPTDPARAPFASELWLAAIGLLFDAVTGLAGLALLLLFALSLLLYPLVYIGLPLPVWSAALLLRLSRFQRRPMLITLGAEIGEPTAVETAGSARERAHTALTARTLWRSVGYWALRIPLTVLTVGGVVALLAGPIALAALPGYWRNYPTRSADFGPVTIHTWFGTAVAAACALIFLFLATPVLIRWLADLDVVAARALLAPQTLTERVAELTTSRQRVVDSAEAERRRIERDLHDGAQQRLVSLAMLLGRVRSRLGPDADPVTRELVDQAHREAKASITELRDLTRGLHPPVLTDRGLDAALSAVAARAPIPVSIEVAPELTGEHRPPATLEAIVYFVVAEALTNVAKHAGASHAWVRVTRTPARLRAVIIDDGRGGAHPVPGGGLTGIADRLSGVDGTLHIDSPATGTTTVTVEVPCAS
ncbi:sensor histidine kinase [Speluncibacter jeojiensis]|uniref:histidine kinase n=1 Tax=Speluncibacter jeojiensis TaxID=2710754 RepID=A0A9X4M4E3_9ACTN|nr:sensor domain-containing protein [Corynebacteriales bacterium D3-21]